MRATGVPPKPAICQSPIWLSALHTSNYADECGVGYATSYPIPKKEWVQLLLHTNGFWRQPDWPPVELAAGLVHTIRHVTCHAWASPSAWCLHPYFCCFQSLTLCVIFNFCLYNPWCCCIPYFGVDTGSSSGPLLGRPPPLNPTLALHLISGHPLTLILGTQNLIFWHNTYRKRNCVSNFPH